MRSVRICLNWQIYLDYKDMTSRKELKIYRLVDRIMRYGHGKVSYEDALKSATVYYTNKSPFLGWGTHVGADYTAHAICERLAK